MNIYHGWCDLKPGVSDLEFAEKAAAYFEHLKAEGLLVAYRITRRKLGLGPDDLGEFHLMMEFEDLGQLDKAFGVVSSRADPVEAFHHGVNSLVRNARFALYRDFPDTNRQRGEERF